MGRRRAASQPSEPVKTGTDPVDNEVRNTLGEEEQKPRIVGDIEHDEGDDIIVGEPLSLEPQDLPLVVRLPRGASSAQIEYAKIINSYAYQNRKKWDKKKDVMIARLKSLAGKEVEVDPKTKLKFERNGFGSSVSFSFIKDGKGGEFYGG